MAMPEQRTWRPDPDPSVALLLRHVLHSSVTRVEVHVPAALRTYWGGPPKVLVDAATVRAALEGLGPLTGRVLDDVGRVRRHIRVFVNHDIVEELGTPVRDGDVVHILPAVSGGVS